MHRILNEPWKVANSHGTASLGKRVTPGLDINALFMWFYTTSSGASTVLGGKKVASPYHPHKFHGKDIDKIHRDDTNSINLPIAISTFYDSRYGLCWYELHA